MHCAVQQFLRDGSTGEATVPPAARAPHRSLREHRPRLPCLLRPWHRANAHDRERVSFPLAPDLA